MAKAVINTNSLQASSAALRAAQLEDALAIVRKNKARRTRKASKIVDATPTGKAFILPAVVKPITSPTIVFPPEPTRDEFASEQAFINALHGWQHRVGRYRR